MAEPLEPWGQVQWPGDGQATLEADSRLLTQGGPADLDILV